nr:hypothetical protein LKV13_04840 [Borrelia sp. BU AG58]
MVKVVCILFLSLLSLNLVATLPARPFNFKNWDFGQDVEDAYGLGYEYREGVLIEVADSVRQRRADRILKKIADLDNYYDALLGLIRDDLFFKVEAEFLRKGGQYSDDDILLEADHRIQNVIEMPMDKRLGKERHRLFNFSNKNLIQSPDYTKLFINIQLQEIDFLENYITRRLGIKFDSGNNTGGARPTGGTRPTGGARSTGGVRSAPTGDGRPTGSIRPTRGGRPTGGARPTGGGRPTRGGRPTGGRPLYNFE